MGNKVRRVKPNISQPFWRQSFCRNGIRMAHVELSIGKNRVWIRNWMIINKLFDMHRVRPYVQSVQHVQQTSLCHRNHVNCNCMLNVHLNMSCSGPMINIIWRFRCKKFSVSAHPLPRFRKVFLPAKCFLLYQPRSNIFRSFSLVAFSGKHYSKLHAWNSKRFRAVGKTFTLGENLESFYITRKEKLLENFKIVTHVSNSGDKTGLKQFSTITRLIYTVTTFR